MDTALVPLEHAEMDAALILELDDREGARERREAARNGSEGAKPDGRRRSSRGRLSPADSLCRRHQLFHWPTSALHVVDEVPRVTSSERALVLVRSRTFAHRSSRDSRASVSFEHLSITLDSAASPPLERVPARDILLVLDRTTPHRPPHLSAACQSHGLPDEHPLTGIIACDRVRLRGVASLGSRSGCPQRSLQRAALPARRC